jgi:hypothetical protein
VVLCISVRHAFDFSLFRINVMSMDDCVSDPAESDDKQQSGRDEFCPLHHARVSRSGGAVEMPKDMPVPELRSGYWAWHPEGALSGGL